MVSECRRLYTITSLSGHEFSQAIPLELERRSEVLQNALSVKYAGSNPRLVLPKPACAGLEPWIRVAGIGSSAVTDDYTTDVFLKALTAADYFADQETVQFAADWLAARLFDVPAGQIGHGIGPKGPTHARITQHHTHETHLPECCRSDQGSRELVATNKTIIGGLPYHLGIAILSSTKTSLKKCVRGLPASLLPLALEARYPTIRTHKHLSLDHLEVPSRAADRALVLRAAATLTFLQSLEVCSSWTHPYAGSTENKLPYLTVCLRSLTSLQISNRAHPDTLNEQTLTNLQSIALKPDKWAPSSLVDVDLKYWLFQLRSFHTLRSVVVHGVQDDVREEDWLNFTGAPGWQPGGSSSALTALDLSLRLPDCKSPLILELSDMWSRAQNLRSLRLKAICTERADTFSFPWQSSVLSSIAQLQGLTELALGRLFSNWSPYSIIEWQCQDTSAAVVEMLEHLHNLQSLELDGYGIPSSFVESITRAISNMSQLRSLRLSYFCSKGDVLCQCLAQHPPCGATLQSLQFSKMLLLQEAHKDIGAVLGHVGNLQELCMDTCSLSNVHSEFWDGIENLSKLQTLSLCQNFPSAQDFEHLARCCRVLRLTRLDLCTTYFKHLSISNIGVDAREALVACVQNMPTLQVLSVSRDAVADHKRFELEVEAVVSQARFSGRRMKSSDSLVRWDQWPAHISEYTAQGACPDGRGSDSDELSDDGE